MSNERTLTRKQLVAAFEEWEEERRAEPENHGFENLDDGPVSTVAKIQVDYVFELVDRQEKA